MPYRKWKIGKPQAQEVQAVANSLACGELLAGILVSRGQNTPEKALEMLAENKPISNPFLLKDMDKAVACITQAIENETPMVIFGDYDVDGVTATALLYSYLVNQGAVVFYKLANRADDGYGLSVNIVDDIADKGIQLIITVDNGVSAHEAVLRAAERGLQMVITDHHLPPGDLPVAQAVVNPHRVDDTSPFAGFCGAGVAFLLVSAMEGCPPDELLPEYGDLAAIGTVADVMKLTGENRILVRAGLKYLQNTQRPGLAALLHIAGYQNREITSETISYGLAPRLNAAGRMDDATDALRLLLAEDEEEGEALAQLLQERNVERQQTELTIVQQIHALIDSSPDLQKARVLVVWGENWHPGIIGIVASRLVERYLKPTIVIAIEGEECRGSGRSMQGFSLYGAIASCEDILIRYGGHDLAAGLSIAPEQLEAFRQRVNSWAAENVPVVSLPDTVVDCTVPLANINVAAVNELSRLAPFGSGNPSPNFLLENVIIDAVYSVSEGKHSRLRFRDDTGCAFYAVLFGTGPDKLAYHSGDKVNAIVVLSIFEGKSGPMVSSRIVEMRPAALGETHVEQTLLFEHFNGGGQPTETARTLLYPSRETVAEVYRQVQTGKAVNYLDLRPMFAVLGEANTARDLCALAVLEELGLVQKNDSTGCYETVKVTDKRPLSNSTLLKRLEV